MPVASIPMIDYLIDYLSDNNMEEVYILCTVHAQKISEYVKSQHYKSSRNLKINIVQCKEATSAGSALRSLLESHGDSPLLSEDFVVLRGDVITNMPLEKAIKEHLERKAKSQDKWMVTKTFVRMCHGNRLRGNDDDILLVTDPDSKLIVQYNKLHGEDKVSLKGCNIPLNTSYELRYDLFDCRIDICTPDLLFYLKENFVCKDLQETFVNDVNGPESIAEGKVYYYEHNESKTSYCAVMHNPLVYDYVNRDIIKRYAYPLVIDSNLMCPAAGLTYKYMRNNIYMEENTKLSMTCIISANSVIGKDTEVHDKANITDSVIGRGCVIGANCKITGSYIWNNTKIEEGCVINGAIICDNAIIRKGTIIMKGTVIDKNVIVKSDKVIPENYYASLFTYSKKDKTYIEATENGDLFEKGVLCDLNRKDQLANYQHIGGLPYCLLDTAQQNIIETDEESDVQEENTTDSILNRFLNTKIDFLSELKSTITRAIENNFSKEDTRMEILSLRLAENKSPGECLYGIIPCILDTIFTPSDQKMPVIVKKIKSTVDEWQGFLKDFIHDSTDEDVTIEIIEEYCSKSDFLTSCFHLILPPMQDAELLSDTAIYRWADKVTEQIKSDKKNSQIEKMLKNVFFGF